MRYKKRTLNTHFYQQQIRLSISYFIPHLLSTPDAFLAKTRIAVMKPPCINTLIYISVIRMKMQLNIILWFSANHSGCSSRLSKRILSVTESNVIALRKIHPCLNIKALSPMIRASIISCSLIRKRHTGRLRSYMSQDARKNELAPLALLMAILLM